jgi:hypothetical protein
MASANSAILEQILSSIQVLQADVSALKTDVSGIKKELGDLKHEFHAYIKREGLIQESIDINKFLHAWENEHITPAYVSLFRDFFRASNGSLLTDLDGCVLIGKPAHSVYIIESKHAFTVDELLKKLTQFCTMLDILESLHTKGTEWLVKQSSEFQTMVAKHDLIHFPKDIYFMFASDSMSKTMQSYITKINSGMVERNELQQVRQFQSSELFERIQLSSDVPIWAKERLKKANSVNAIIKIITNISAKLEDYKEAMMTMFPESDPCFKQLQGRLGILCLDVVVWPTGSSSLHKGGKRKTRRNHIA